jgi:hypothetical protein
MLSSVLCMRVMAVPEQMTAAAFIYSCDWIAGHLLLGWDWPVGPAGMAWHLMWHLVGPSGLSHKNPGVRHVGMGGANQELPLAIVGKEWMR